MALFRRRRTAFFEARRDYEGEHITIYWGDAGFDFPTLNLMLEVASG